MNCRPGAQRLAALVLALTWAAAAQAGSVRYRCEGGLELQADLTPRAGRVLVAGVWYDMKRTRGTAPQYVNSAHKLVLTPKGRKATWQQADQPERPCELVLPEFVHHPEAGR